MTDTTSPSNDPQSEVNRDRIFFKIGDEYRAINLQLISYFFSEGKITYAKMGSRNLPINVQLKTLEKSLHPQFLRCHENFVINVSNIQAIFLKESKVEINGELLAIGYTYRKDFLESLFILK